MGETVHFRRCFARKDKDQRESKNKYRAQREDFRDDGAPIPDQQSETSDPKAPINRRERPAAEDANNRQNCRENTPSAKERDARDIIVVTADATQAREQDQHEKHRGQSKPLARLRKKSFDYRQHASAPIKACIGSYL